MRLQSVFASVAIVGLLALWPEFSIAEESSPLIVHEWGTFTALESEGGEQLLGINVDTEPVPSFVHNLGRFLLNSPVLSSKHWIHVQQGTPRNHPDVSLRLETPVIYFYPAPGTALPMTVDVDVKFRAGWLTEFYPRADIRYPKVQNGEFQFEELTQKTIGNIAWKNLKVGTSEPGPETNDHVWVAPRKVAAANITSAEGEHEKYLFYRGVARQIAPLRVMTNKTGESIAIQATFQTVLDLNQQSAIKNLWLMETREDGTCAYRRLEPITYANDRIPPRNFLAKRRFSEPEFDSENRRRLEAEMHATLLQEGLFADEATAMLSTWQQAYFVSPGLRVFYTVPREWTDFNMPLTISGNPKITRVMVGRVELISDTQRELLSKLATAPITSGKWMDKIPFDSPALQKLLSGRSDFGDLGVPIPADFQMYLDLGRFRNALVAAEEKRLKSANLAKFIKENQLDPFRLSQRSGK